MKITNYLKENYVIAYWLTSGGELLDITPKSHISYIIEEPRKFGLSLNDIKSIYKKYDEPIYSEGKGREEIITKVLKNGFIRLRRYNKYWSVNVWKYNSKIERILSDWSYQILQNGIEKDKYIPVKISAIEGNPPTKIDMITLSGFISEHKKIHYTTLNEMCYLIKSDIQLAFDSLYQKELEAGKAIYNRTINESGLSRILSKLQDQNTEFIIITAFRRDNSLSVNQENNNSLLKDFRAIGKNPKGFGAYHLIGHWKECDKELTDDMSIDDCDKIGGTLHDSIEEAWLIMNDKHIDSKTFFSIAISIAKKFKQDGFIAKIHNEPFGVYNKNGGLMYEFNNITSNSFKSGFEKLVNLQGYSEIKKVKNRGRIFNIIFESIGIVTIPGVNNMETQIFRLLNLLKP